MLSRFNAKFLNRFKNIPQRKIFNLPNVKSYASLSRPIFIEKQAMFGFKEKLDPKEYDSMDRDFKSFYNPVFEFSYADCILSKRIMRYERKLSIPEALTKDQVEKLSHITKAQYYALTNEQTVLFEEITDKNDKMFSHYIKKPVLKIEQVRTHSMALTEEQLNQLDEISKAQYDILSDNLKNMISIEERETGGYMDRIFYETLYLVKKPQMSYKKTKFHKL